MLDSIVAFTLYYRAVRHVEQSNGELLRYLHTHLLLCTISPILVEQSNNIIAFIIIVSAHLRGEGIVNTIWQTPPPLLGFHNSLKSYISNT